MIKKLVLIIYFFSLSLFLSSNVLAFSRCPKEETQKIINTLWNYWRPNLNNSLKNSLEKGNPQVLYNIQTNVQNLLESAAACHDLKILDDLSNLLLIAFPYLKENSSGYKEWLCSTDACPEYKSYANKEIILYSSQFIYLLSRTSRIITDLPNNQQSEKMKEFLEKYSPVIINDHLHKWINEGKLFEVSSWGCQDKNYYNHRQFLEKKLSRSLGNSPTYCNVVRDVDLFIIASSAEILAADKNSQLINLTAGQKQELLEEVDIGSRLIVSRLKEINIRDFSNKPVIGLVFDPGEWRDYKDYLYAGYTGESFPNENDKKTVEDLGWDLSHGRRFVWIFNSLYESRQVTDQNFPDSSILEKFANMIAYKVFNGNYSQPLFANFLNGSNGWYRVNYSQRVGFAYGPSDLSISFPTGGYSFLGEYNV